MDSDATPPPASPPAGSKPVSALLLFLLLFVAYNVNFRDIRFSDTAPARVLPFCLLLNHSLYLDGWIEPYVAAAGGVNGTYFVARSHGHWMSAYPIIMPLVITPLYVVPAWLVARQHPPLVMGDLVLMTLIDIMEKLAASLIAALSAVILYFALRKIISPHLSLLLTLVYGLAGSVWSISAQGLWRHGFTQLSFALLLWALWSHAEWRGRAWWAGVALAAAAANKPADVAIVLPFLIYFARRGKGEFLRFFVPLAVLGTLVLSYNLYFFHRLLGGYATPLVQGYKLVGPEARVWAIVEAAAGLLISPSRGLLIYIPWTVLALWGAARVWKENSYGWGRYLLVGMGGVFVEQTALGSWWAGWCFGPRYLADLLPLLICLLLPIVPRVRSVPALRIVAVVAVLMAVWIQVIGAFFYPRGWWDALPTNVDLDQSRLWDWKDTQIHRTWEAGPAPPYLFYGLFVLKNLLHHPATTGLPRRGESETGPKAWEDYTRTLTAVGRRSRCTAATVAAPKAATLASGKQERKTRKASRFPLASRSKSWKKGSRLCQNSGGWYSRRAARPYTLRNSRVSSSSARRSILTWSWKRSLERKTSWSSSSCMRKNSLMVRVLKRWDERLRSEIARRTSGMNLLMA